MPDSDAIDPIADHELLYRRNPTSQGYYDPAVDSNPSPLNIARPSAAA